MPAIATEQAYSRAEVRRLLGVSEQQLRSWQKQDFVRASSSFSFSDLLAMRTLAALRKNRVPASQIRKAVNAVRSKLRDVVNPLTELRLYSQGRKVRVQFGNQTMEPVSGQLLLDFEEEINKILAFPEKQPEAEKPAERNKKRLEAEHWFEQGLLLEQQGVEVEVHHHEVAAPGQNEIGTKFASLVKRADWMQILKYTIWNVAASYGKTATFMPKPVVGDNGSGMHVHQSVWKDGQNLFAGNGYGGLSEFALYYIGGIIKHARALNAITNPGTNSYKRLVPGFEAPINLAYSARNRSAACRIPYVSSPKARRVEVRFPDPTANAYLAFAAMLMAGLDGVQNKIHPGDPVDKNLYDLEPEEAAKVPTVCHSLDQALGILDKDREFLTRGGVFTNDVLDAYISLKMEEVTRFRMTTHPVEFDMYFGS